jgi:phosphoglycerol transferase MdoB-like AlkP superfamily enzyme
MNALLMTEQRQTVVTNFAHRGYRTLAVMPGLWYPWPEGAFYGFQDLYNGPRLDYKGPSFGWWDMPDQFTLAKLDEQEVSKVDRRPLFVFYPTVTTHTPFSPVPPYQPDWNRMVTPEPFSAAELDRAYVGEPDYMNLGPGYVDAVAYTYETFAGYIRQRAGRPYVMILIGDHQPPAIVSGEHASWDVPMHVVTNRPGVLESLMAHGFIAGLTPRRPRIGEMHEVVPMLLDAMSGPPPLDAAMRGR